MLKHIDIATVISFIYWIYLLDPFTRESIKRNYLKLYKNHKYLHFNLCLSVVLVLTNKPVTGLPLFFILTTLITNRFSLQLFKRHFFLILRGDPAKGMFVDYLFSFCLIGLPLGLTIYMLISFQQ